MILIFHLFTFFTWTSSLPELEIYYMKSSMGAADKRGLFGCLIIWLSGAATTRLLNEKKKKNVRVIVYIVEYNMVAKVEKKYWIKPMELQPMYE